MQNNPTAPPSYDKDTPMVDPKGDDEAAVARPKVMLKKRITLFHCVSIIVGIIVGAGIFVSPVGITIHMRSVGMSILVVRGGRVLYSMRSVLRGAGGVPYRVGGEYVYIKRAWGDFPAFMCLWMNYILINLVSVTAATHIFANYVLRPAFSDCDPPPEAIRILAALIIGETWRQAKIEDKI
ncbi:Y+l amino acid transporter 2 [Plakobranchus ocellatus]|uniref:Y+l amino acid transporter 2 n=1 Tax=Plakobranchus ocellatus TaxID=259542 RepID=A0AAV3YMU0_9GAST|nr:Y+l amino acid transporter 2 [Plakobranchus ocellatus]